MSKYIPAYDDSDASPPQYRSRDSYIKSDRNPFDDKSMSSDDSGDDRPLPSGWIRQLDRSSSSYYYVDTLASPSRSIWVHPVDDPQWRQDQAPRSGPPPSRYASGSISKIDERAGHSSDYQERNDLEHDFTSTRDQVQSPASTSRSGSVLSKVATGAVWVMEQRSARKDRKEEEKYHRRSLKHGRCSGRRGVDLSDRLAQRFAPNQQMQYAAGPMYTNNGYQGGPAYASPQTSMGYDRQGGPVYAAPPQVVYAQGPGYGNGGYGYRDDVRGRRSSGGNGLIRGLIGGMILGDIID